MNELRKDPMILSEYYYAYEDFPSEFSLVNAQLPNLTYSDEASIYLYQALG